MRTTSTTTASPEPFDLDPASRETVPCYDSATGELLGHVPAMGRDEVVAAVERGRIAQRAWAETSFAVRRRVLRDVLATIVDHQDEICRLAARDSGKTMVDAALGELFATCEKLRWVMRNGEQALRSQRRASGPLLLHKRGWVEYQPLGVVGVIAPWNFPFHNMFGPTIPALFAGNAVVVKVSEHSSWSAADYVDIFQRALRENGCSPDLVQVVTGYGETGAALVGSGVDKIFFTGSPHNGKKVMAEAAKTLTPVVLELGGKDPMIVLDDADLEQAVGTALLGVYTACGQMCVGAERIIVQDGIYQRFVDRVVERVAALRQGAPLAAPADTDVGAMTMPGQLDIIDALVADAVARGARVLVGGERNAAVGPQFYKPTVLVDVTPDMRIAREETFGPVMTVMRFSSDDEAARIANDCDYGLGSSIISKNLRRAERLARHVSAGMTVINDYGLAYMMQSLPFGGVRISGFGKINGVEGMRACCNQKAFVTDRFALHRDLSFYPIGAHSFPRLREAIRLVYGRGIAQRARAAAALVGQLVKRG